MTPFQAKMAREAKENPVDWVIAPTDEPGVFKLISVCGGIDQHGHGNHSVDNSDRDHNLHLIER